MGEFEWNGGDEVVGFWVKKLVSVGMVGMGGVIVEVEEKEVCVMVNAEEVEGVGRLEGIG